MKPKPDWIGARQSLRTKAEGMLSGISAVDMEAKPTEVLLHELLVHKVELEMQVEELKRAHAITEEARDRYWDFYESAPVGYITINREGLIGEINLTGATMLGAERLKLVNSRFSTFVSPLDGNRWQHLLTQMMEQADTAPRAIVVEMIRGNATTFPAHLECRRGESIDGTAMLRLALIDISRIRQAEAEMQATRNAALGFEAQ